MRDPGIKPRPMIDFKEFERRLHQPSLTNDRDGAQIAELLRIIGGPNEPPRTPFEPKSHESAEARHDTGGLGDRKGEPDGQQSAINGGFAAIAAGLLNGTPPHTALPPGTEMSNAEAKRTNTEVPLISGDFAAIEAGLLGAQREQTGAIVSESGVPNAFPEVDLGSERWLGQDKTPASLHTAASGRQIRSRRRLYALAAIVIVGVAGTIVSFGLKNSFSNMPETAMIETENGPAKLHADTTTGAGVSARDTTSLSKPPEPSPVAPLNNTQQPPELPRADDTTPPTVTHARSQTQIDNGPPILATAAQAPAEPLGIMTPVEPEKMKTDLGRPDGTVLPNGRPPQTNIMGTPLPPRHPAAAAKVGSVKAAPQATKTPKPVAATELGGQRQARPIVNKAKTTPASPLNAEPALTADVGAEAPAPRPSPAADGAFGFVQSTVNSLTNTTAKLLEWGRIETRLSP